METNRLNTSGSTPQLPPATLRAGARLQATVTADLSQQRYSLSLAGREIEIQSPLPLQTGQKLTVQIVRQESGELGLQLLRDSLPDDNAATSTRATQAAGATAQVSRPAEVTLPADQLRALLPAATAAGDASAPAASAAPSQTATADAPGSAAARSSATADTVGEDATAQTPARPSAAVSSAAANNAPTSDSYAGLVLRIVSDNTSGSAGAGNATLQGPSGQAVAATVLLTAAATATDSPGELLQASAQPLFRVQDVALQLLLGAAPAPASVSAAGSAATLPDMSELFPSLLEAAASGAVSVQDAAAPAALPLTARLPLTPQLLQALPSSLAGLVLTLQPISEHAGSSQATAAAGSTPTGMALYAVSYDGNPLPALLTLPAGTPAEATARVAVLPEAVIEGSLQTSRSAPQMPASRDSLDARLMQAGLTPGTSTREAAQALSEQNVPLSRGNVQTLLALAAGRTGEERAAFLQAGARLLALDAPVSPALAAGMANLHGGAAGLAQQSATAAGALSAAANNLPDAIGAALRDAARLTGSLAIMVGTGDTPQALSGFVSTLGREVLAGAQAAVESATAAQLASSAILPRLDAALEVILARLSNIPADATSATGAANTTVSQTPPPITGAPSAPAAATTASVIPVAQPQPESAPGPASTPVATPSAASNAELAQRLRLALTMFTQAGFTTAVGAHPGVQDFPAYARPVDAYALSGSGGTPDRARLEGILHDLARAGSPEEATRTARDAMRGIDAHTLRELAAVLQQAERSEIDQLPGLRELRDASDALRDLGRTFVAQKAENLAAQEPLVWSGSVPLKFGNDSKDGHLQMFYRKGGKEGKDWTQRVVLDLDMSAIGTVVGDLKFLNGQLTVALLAPEAQTVRWLESGSEELAAGLEAAGFPCAPAFRVLPRKSAATAGLQEDKAEPTPRTAPGRLDIRA